MNHDPDPIEAALELLRSITDEANPRRVSIGFSPCYVQDDFIIDWLETNSLNAAIDATRRAARDGRLVNSDEELAELERVRVMVDVDQFVKERETARDQYDAYCVTIPARLRELECLAADRRLDGLISIVREAKTRDEHFHAYMLNYNRPGTLATRLGASVEAEIGSLIDLGIPYPLPSYALIEGIVLLAVAGELRDQSSRGFSSDDVRDLGRAIARKSSEEGLAASVVELARWVFARGSDITLATKLGASGWLTWSEDERGAIARRLSHSRVSAMRRFEEAAKPLPSHSVLAPFVRLLNLDHVEDALRSVVYNGLEDYIARKELALELHRRGVLGVHDPMALPQNELLSLAESVG